MTDRWGVIASRQARPQPQSTHGVEQGEPTSNQELSHGPDSLWQDRRHSGDDGVELVELTEPMKALNEAGASVEIVSLKAGDFQGFNHLTPGDKVTADKAVAGVDASAYSA